VSVALVIKRGGIPLDRSAAMEAASSKHKLDQHWQVESFSSHQIGVAGHVDLELVAVYSETSVGWTRLNSRDAIGPAKTVAEIIRQAGHHAVAVQIVPLLRNAQSTLKRGQDILPNFAGRALAFEPASPPLSQPVNISMTCRRLIDRPDSGAPRETTSSRRNNARVRTRRKRQTQTN
jgi:hypothetical protein